MLLKEQPIAPLMFLESKNLVAQRVRLAGEPAGPAPDPLFSVDRPSQPRHGGEIGGAEPLRLHFQRHPEAAAACPGNRRGSGRGCSRRASRRRPARLASSTRGVERDGDGERVVHGDGARRPRLPSVEIMRRGVA